jgi:molybdate transport system substrate-binding protein
MLCSRLFSVIIGVALGFSQAALARAENPAALVAAASSMKFVFEDLAPTFHARHPEFRVQFSFGSSGNIFSQVTHGAPFDIFFSADMTYPEKLAAAGQALPGAEVVPYGAGKIVLWMPSALALDPRAEKMNTLQDPHVRKIAIANPKHAPYGRAAIQALKRAGLYRRVQSKLILGENITQAAQFVHTGAAEAGLIALSLARTAKMSALGTYWEVPAGDYDAIRQGFLMLKGGRNPEAARAFADFVSGPVGREVLLRYGFKPLPGDAP